MWQIVIFAAHPDRYINESRYYLDFGLDLCVVKWPFDVVSMQVWKKEDFQYLVKELEHILPYHHYFHWLETYR